MAQSAEGVEESPHSRDHRGRVRELTATATCARGPVAKFQYFSVLSHILTAPSLLLSHDVCHVFFVLLYLTSFLR